MSQGTSLVHRIFGGYHRSQGEKCCVMKKEPYLMCCDVFSEMLEV